MKAKKKPYLLNKYMNVKEFNQMKKTSCPCDARPARHKFK